MGTTPTTRVSDLARRYRIDIDLGTYPAVNYQQLMGVEEFKSAEELRTETDEMYEDGGADRDAVTGYGVELQIKMAYSKNAAGTARDTNQAYLRAKYLAARTSNVTDGEFGVRWYDRNGIATEAQEARAYVRSWSESGGKGRNLVDIVIKTQGAIAQITNPNGSLVPVVSSVVPVTGAAAGGSDPILVYGIHFTGATAVDFGATSAPDFVIVNDGTIAVVPPAHAAGLVQVKVTTPAGASSNTAADDYTYV